MRWLVDARPLVDPSQGGVSRVARCLIEAFTKSFPNDELVLVTTGISPSTRYSLLATRFPNCRHIHIRLPNKLWSLLSYFRLTSLDRAVEKRVGKIDAVFLPNLAFTGLLATRYSLLLHDLSFLIEPRWFSRRMRWWHRAVRAKQLIKNAAHLLAVSETTKRDAVRLLGIDEKRITVIPIGPTLSDMSLREASPTSDAAIFQKRYILALGGNDPRKNTTTAIAAVQEIKKDPAFQDLELIIVGGSNKPSDSDLASLYQNASAFLYPSWYEGYGLPLHEAAAFGTPRIASTAGALTETAPPGTLFADPAKPHHWVEALRVALDGPRPEPIRSQPEKWLIAAKILHSVLDGLIK